MSLKTSDLIRLYNDFDKRVWFDVVNEIMGHQAKTMEYWKLDLKSDKVIGTCVTYRVATDDEKQDYINNLKSYPLITESIIIGAIYDLLRIDKDDLCEDGREIYYSLSNIVNHYFTQQGLDYNKPFILDKSYNGEYELVTYRTDIYDHSKDRLNKDFMDNEVINPSH